MQFVVNYNLWLLNCMKIVNEKSGKKLIVLLAKRPFFASCKLTLYITKIDNLILHINKQKFSRNILHYLKSMKL